MTLTKTLLGAVPSLALASIGTAMRAGSVPESQRWIYKTFNVVA